MRNYYEILGVPQTVSTVEIQKRWRKLSAEYHPDKTGGNKLMEECLKYINEAYSVLKDPVKRAAHDTELAAAVANSRQQAVFTAPPVIRFDVNTFRPVLELIVQGLIKLLIEELDGAGGRRKMTRKKGARTIRASSGKK
jgi:DnaJ-class molecular chaperone